MKLAVLGWNGASGLGSANLDKVGLRSAGISPAERTGVEWLKKPLSHLSQLWVTGNISINFRFALMCCV